MENRARGDVSLRINGRDETLRLTLGALAEIESAFDAGDLAALAARLSHPTAADMLLVLSALLRGGGAIVSAEELKRADLDLGAAARAVGNAFRAAGLSAGADARNE